MRAEPVSATQKGASPIGVSRLKTTGSGCARQGQFFLGIMHRKGGCQGLIKHPRSTAVLSGRMHLWILYVPTLMATLG